MRVVARTSSGVSDHREGDWISVQPAEGSGSLPQWTARQASILWLCVRPGAAWTGTLHASCQTISFPTSSERVTGNFNGMKSTPLGALSRNAETTLKKC